MFSPFSSTIWSPGLSPALTAAPWGSTDRMKTGALPLSVNPNPACPRSTCTYLWGVNTFVTTTGPTTTTGLPRSPLSPGTSSSEVWHARPPRRIPAAREEHPLITCSNPSQHSNQYLPMEASGRGRSCDPLLRKWVFVKETRVSNWG